MNRQNAERRTQNAEHLQTWQRPTQAPRAPSARHERTPPPAPAGGRRGVVPPGNRRRTQNAQKRGKRPAQYLHTPGQARDYLRRAPAGVEGGSSPWASPAGGRRGVVPPGHHRRRVEGGSSPWRTVDRSPSNVATGPRPTSTPPAKHERTPPPAPAGGRKGVVPPGHHRRGVEGGSSPLGITDRGSKGLGLLTVHRGNRATTNLHTPGQARDYLRRAPAGGRRGVVPPGHHRRGVEGVRTVDRSPWQPGHDQPPHPRPSTRLPTTHRRGVEGGSSPLGITGGGSKGLGLLTVHRGNRATTNLHTPGQARDYLRRAPAGGRRGVVPPGHHRRGVEGGSSPLGIKEPSDPHTD